MLQELGDLGHNRGRRSHFQAWPRSSGGGAATVACRGSAGCGRRVGVTREQAVPPQADQ